MIYAKIDSGIVVDVQLLEAEDDKDPAFVWEDLTDIKPQPSVGWSFDGTNYAPPPIAVPVLSVAKAQNISSFRDAMQAFVDSRYPLDIRFNFIAIYINAQQNGLTNRMAYVSRIFPWMNATIAYAAQYVGSVQAGNDPATVVAKTWDFSTLIDSDPLITPIAAIQINS